MTDTAAFPYLSIPREARWAKVMDGRAPSDIDPHVNMRLRIKPSDKIASAGSCFAQQIATLLQNDGYNYILAEEGPPLISADEKKRLGYGIYSARYGNIYSALQLLQLLRRAFGRYEPSEPIWQLPNGRFVDPFRPAVQPDGFANIDECLWDRKNHLVAVRNMFEEVDIFAFTLGLSEAWCSTVDGAAFPACPGSPLGGTFDPARHQFHNFSVTEVTAHLDSFITELRAVNPKAQMILTLSPIPLLATYESRHVLQANTYSKAVLRVACEEIIRKYDHVHYFASYEVVVGTGDSKSYFQDDHRSVSATAVAHVLDCFRRQLTDKDAPPLPKADAAVKAHSRPMCDEDSVMAALDAADNGDK